MPRDPKPRQDPERIRDIAEAVYRERLGASGVASMIESDGDGGKKLCSRAGCYDVLGAPFCRALGVPVPMLEEEKESADA